VAGAEKRTHLHFTRSGSVQGRAPSSPLQRTQVRSGRRRNTGTLIEAETSRDRSRRRVRTAHGAVGRRRKASRIVVQAALHGTLANTVSADSADSRSRKRPGAAGMRQGCQRHGGVGSTRKKTPRHQPETTRRSGSGVVKRQVPQSPSSRVQARGRRGEAQASKRSWERMWRECS